MVDALTLMLVISPIFDSVFSFSVTNKVGKPFSSSMDLLSKDLYRLLISVAAIFYSHSTLVEFI